MPELYEYALARGEGVMAQGGPLAVRTNKTGRSPKDRFIVEDDLTRDTVWFSPETFGRLLQKMLAYAAERELFVQELYAGSDPAERLQVRFIQEMAYHSLFVHHMFVRPTPAERASFQADWTVINILSFRADPETDGTRSDTFILRHRIRGRKQKKHVQRAELPAARARRDAHALLVQRGRSGRHGPLFWAQWHRQDDPERRPAPFSRGA